MLFPGDWRGPRLGDTNVTILKELLEWSQDRPAWQRDALRRLVLNGDLSDDDISALIDICKSTHGLTEPKDSAPLNKGKIGTSYIAPVKKKVDKIKTSVFSI
jgi:hypothetical protein